MLHVYQVRIVIVALVVRRVGRFALRADRQSRGAERHQGTAHQNNHLTYRQARPRSKGTSFISLMDKHGRDPKVLPSSHSLTSSMAAIQMYLYHLTYGQARPQSKGTSIISLIDNHVRR